MTVKEIAEKMDDFTDEERGTHLRLLCESLTPVSKAQLLAFQNDWKPEFKTTHNIVADFKKFKTAQNKEIRRCLEIELSESGSRVRQSLGLQPLHEEDEIKESEEVTK